MIRLCEPDDTPALVALASGTGVFKPAEITALQEVLADYHAREQNHGHCAVTLEEERLPAGFAYYAPSAMSDRGWYLWWIAVERQRQGRGFGSRLLRYAEEDIKAKHGRLILIETSSSNKYDVTRQFYLGHGYEVNAVLRDFYADHDDLVVFAKRVDGRAR
jgi:ribosomal protein S18 acetylase RimI-like enzyme